MGHENGGWMNEDQRGASGFDTFAQSTQRAEGYAAMTTRLIGCMGDASIREPRQAAIAYLEGMLTSLDKTRASITETIDRIEASIERAAEAAIA